MELLRDKAQERLQTAAGNLLLSLQKEAMSFGLAFSNFLGHAVSYKTRCTTVLSLTKHK